MGARVSSCRSRPRCSSCMPGGGLQAPPLVEGYGQPYSADGSALGSFVPLSRICLLLTEGSEYFIGPMVPFFPCRSDVVSVLLSALVAAASVVLLAVLASSDDEVSRLYLRWQDCTSLEPPACQGDARGLASSHSAKAGAVGAQLAVNQALHAAHMHLRPWLNEQGNPPLPQAEAVHAIVDATSGWSQDRHHAPATRVHATQLGSRWQASAHCPAFAVWGMTLPDLAAKLT